MMRKVLCGAGIGALIGLLIVFMAFAGAMTAATRLESREKLEQQRSEASFQNMTRDEWVYKQNKPDPILGRIAVSQARSGDIDSATKNIEAIKKLDPDIVRHVAVHEMLHRVVQYGKVENPEQKLKPVLDKARTITKGINDPLLQADALRRIADVQEQYMEGPADKEQARKTYEDASKLVLSRPADPEPTVYWFNPWLLLWPAGLAIFAAMLLALLMPIMDMAAFARKPSKITAEDEGVEDEDDDEEEDQAPAAPPAAEVPDAELTAPPAEEVPMATMEPAMPMAEMPMADVPMASDLADVPMPAAAPPSKMMSAAAKQPAVPAASGNPDKKTMMARSGQPAAATMLAKGAAAQTMLIKGGAATKLAESEDALPLPDDAAGTRKTVKK